MHPKNARFFLKVFLLISCSISSTFSIYAQKNNLVFPYNAAGLTKRQAAAHLISRFTYGARPGDVDAVEKLGLEKWFEKQLEGGFSEDTLQEKLSNIDFLQLTNTEAVATFPRPLQLLRMAAADGVISKDSIKFIDRDEAKERLKDYVKEKNIHQQGELVRAFINQRIIRARYANNQLNEVLTGFWFNHFNVSLTKPQVILLAPAYERDVIRPNILGNFSTLLLATAKSPAMQMYLDNFISSGENDSLESPEMPKYERAIERLESRGDTAKAKALKKINEAKKTKGLNENYARELMELHTLGVDGGYTQSDVTQAARILTGWGIYPIDESYAPFLSRMIKASGEDKLIEKGFVRDGDFMFAMNKHDVKAKQVLGKQFPAGVGYSEGESLIQMLAIHPSTAKFISTKIARYFVSDNPPSSLVAKMTKTFLSTKGNIKAVMTTMVTAPEFWDKAAIRQKTKSPFELIVSATRALECEVKAPFQLFLKMDRMGQKIYYYQAPTGFPDKAAHWINTGALINRMNFGLDIASNKIRGTQTDLLKLNQYHEPGDAFEALKIYSSILLPERSLTATIKRLTPLLTNPDFGNKILNQSNQIAVRSSVTVNAATNSMDEMDLIDDDMTEKQKAMKMKEEKANQNMLAQVVGIILGSPEFQRR